MGIKTKIKHLLAHKEYYPIVHPVISSEEFAGKVILNIFSELAVQV